VLRTTARAIGLVALAALFWMGFVWPPPSWWRTHWPAETAFQRMRARQLHAARDTTARRYAPVPPDSMSQWLERAATAGEDDAFLEHHGVDWRAVRSALGYRFETFTWSRQRDRAELQRVLGRAYERRAKLRGASTITQQLAKNLYLSPSRNPFRKVKEAVIAHRLEWALDKPRILALYLNVAEFGQNLWGVEAASRHYFQRSAARLSMDQAALLVATLPHPLTSNPTYRPGRTRWRQQYILRRLRGERVDMPDEVREDVAIPAPRPDSVPAAPPVVPADSLPPIPTDTATVPPAPDTVAVNRSR
jgi:monofunctional biosynthetic peptidoglycan transglycosylase